MAKGKTSGTTTIQRTMERLRRDGWEVASLERKKPMPAGPVMDDRIGRKRMAFFLTTTVDLFGGIDILAIRDGEILGVQATTHNNRSNHLSKLLSEPRLLKWLRAGAGLELWSWSQEGAAGSRWNVRIDNITVSMFVGGGEAEDAPNRHAKGKRPPAEGQKDEAHQ